MRIEFRRRVPDFFSFLRPEINYLRNQFIPYSKVPSLVPGPALLFCARSGPVKQEFAFTCVARQRCAALELRLRLGEAPELEKKVSANAGQEVVGLERRFRNERVDELEPRRRTEGHGVRDRAIQLYDWRGRKPGERVIERSDSPPVRFCGRTRTRMARGDGRLNGVVAKRAAKPLGTLEGGQTSVNEELIPSCAVLIQQQDRFPSRASSSARARRLNLHERDQPMHLRLVRSKFSQYTAKAEGILAERSAPPVVSGRRRVALVKYEVDHFQHGRQTGG